MFSPGVWGLGCHLEPLPLLHPARFRSGVPSLPGCRLWGSRPALGLHPNLWLGPAARQGPEGSKSSGCTAADLCSDPSSTSSSVALTLEPQWPYLSNKLVSPYSTKGKEIVAALVATEEWGRQCPDRSHSGGTADPGGGTERGTDPIPSHPNSPKAPCTQGSVGSQRSSPLSGCPHTNGAWNVAGPHGGFGLFTL